MKFLCAVLLIVCILEAYLVVDARKGKQVLAATQDNFLNLNILAIKSNIKLTDEIAANPAEALLHLNQAICGGNPFPANFLNNSSVNEKTKASLQALKEEVEAHCKK